MNDANWLPCKAWPAKTLPMLTPSQSQLSTQSLMQEFSLGDQTSIESLCQKPMMAMSSQDSIQWKRPCLASTACGCRLIMNKWSLIQIHSDFLTSPWCFSVHIKEFQFLAILRWKRDCWFVDCFDFHIQIKCWFTWKFRVELGIWKLVKLMHSCQVVKLSRRRHREVVVC